MIQRLAEMKIIHKHMEAWNHDDAEKEDDDDDYDDSDENYDDTATERIIIDYFNKPVLILIAISETHVVIGGGNMLWFNTYR